MNNLLSTYNLLLRKHERYIEDSCIIRKRGSLLHLCLNSPGCRFSREGTCTMCNYGCGKPLSQNDAIQILGELNNYTYDIQSILIGSLGSIFDTDEISRDVLEIICKWLNEKTIHTIIFETHYSTVNEEICDYLNRLLPNKDIVIELGLETVNENVQKFCLNKRINLDAFKDVVNLLHSKNMSVTSNIFLGAPFLSISEQIDDTINTILWSIKNDIDSITIFPANIRKNTLIALLYENGRYNQISNWQILDVLNNIPVNFLNRVFLSWYGDWIDTDKNGLIENIPPYTCKKCKTKWMEFYNDFLNEKNNIKRKKCINKFYLKNSNCECFTRYDSQRKFGINNYSIEDNYNWLRENVHSKLLEEI